MALIQIQEIVRNGPYPDDLWNFSLDIPPGTAYETYTLTLKGWVLGKNQPVNAVLVRDNLERPCGRILMNTPRPDVAAHYPQISHALQCGFQGSINLTGMPLQTQLTLLVELKGGKCLELAVIRLQRTAMQPPDNTVLQPLIVNSIGRTGTTWVMRLLSEHPRVATYRQYPYEGRVASYWIHNLLKMHDHFLPPNPATQVCNVNRDWVNLQLYHRPEAFHWFGKTYLEQLTAFAKQSIDNCFLELARAEGRDMAALQASSAEPVYFAEKNGPSYINGLLWEIYPAAREVVLVRDFRDMYCSIKGFCDKRGGHAQFGLANRTEAEFTEHTAERIDKLVKDWQQRQDKIYLLRYEDLILEPEKTLTALLDYLHLDNSAGVVKALLKKAGADTGNTMKEHRTSRDIKSSVERWRQELSAEQIALLNEKFGRYLTLFGYAV